MQIVIDIPIETYKAISEWEKPNQKYAAEYMLYQFVKNGKRIEQTSCSDAISRQAVDKLIDELARAISDERCFMSRGRSTATIMQDILDLPSVSMEKTNKCGDAISRSEAIRIASGYCHWSNISKELAKLPSVNPKPCEMTAEEYRQRMIQAFHNADCDELIAICVLPTEKEFEHLEWLLKNHYKKEPCGDAISRQAAIDALKNLSGIDGKNVFEKYSLYPWNVIKELPSVSVTGKTGRWIDDEFGSKCSCCGIHTHLDKFDKPMKFRHCSMCGAKMVEPQESEVEE